MWNDLSRQSVSGICSDWHLLARTYRTRGHNCRLGSEPEIYFYSHRHSATGYIYTYGLMEPQKYAHQMQQEMIHEIERASPKDLMSVGIFYSGCGAPDLID